MFIGEGNSHINNLDMADKNHRKKWHNFYSVWFNGGAFLKSPPKVRPKI